MLYYEINIVRKANPRYVSIDNVVLHLLFRINDEIYNFVIIFLVIKNMIIEVNFIMYIYKILIIFVLDSLDKLKNLHRQKNSFVFSKNDIFVDRKLFFNLLFLK